MKISGFSASTRKISIFREAADRSAASSTSSFIVDSMRLTRK